MISSTSVTKFFLLAPLAFAENDSLNLLRGGASKHKITPDQAPDSRSRLLQTDNTIGTTDIGTTAIGSGSGSGSGSVGGSPISIDSNSDSSMSSGLVHMGNLVLASGELKCEEHDPYDGTIICAFRTALADNLNVGKVLNTCLSKYCVTTEVYPGSYNDVPPVSTPTQPANPPSTSTGTQPTTGGGGISTGQVPLYGTTLRADGCPLQGQNTGMTCSEFVPKGASEVSCYYANDIQCNCVLQDDVAVREGWNCRKIEGSNVVPVAAPVPVPVTVPVVQPTIFVDGNIQSVVVPPSSSVTSEFVLPPIINPDYCPATQALAEGQDCNMHQRCMFYVEENNVRTGANNCDCNAEKVYECYPTTHPFFNP
mmetsp:Transcript_25262/g.53207  ORF Transcript_25262/g.53207 Transcript_25262/m.53207 type:complete len:367 (-) Transcript_25262:136-1236(-)